MTRLIGLLAALFVGGCRTVETEIDLAPSGIHTRIILLESDPAVGKPLLVRLELVNDSDVPIIYDDQAVGSNDSLEIVGPDGRRVSYVDIMRSTGGTPQKIAPHSAMVMVDRLDVSAQYRLSLPGPYSIRLAENRVCAIEASKVPGLWQAEAADSGRCERDLDRLISSRLQKPSNTLTFDLR